MWPRTSGRLCPCLLLLVLMLGCATGCAWISARGRGHAAAAPARILLEASQGEFLASDRDASGSYNFGQYEVEQALTEAGYRVESNESSPSLTLDQMRAFQLVILHGRISGTAQPPLEPRFVETCVAYVRSGGSLLVIGAGRDLGAGETARFYNPLLQAFAMKFSETPALEWNENRVALTRHRAVAGLSGFTGYGGVVVDAPHGAVLGRDQDRPVVVMQPFGQGRVVAAGLGTGLLGNCMNPTRSVLTPEQRAENQAFLLRLAATLTQ